MLFNKLLHYKKRNILRLGVFLPIKYLNSGFERHNGFLFAVLSIGVVVQLQQQAFLFLVVLFHFIIVFLHSYSFYSLVSYTGELEKESINHGFMEHEWSEWNCVVVEHICETTPFSQAIVTNCDNVPYYECTRLYVLRCWLCGSSLENILFQSDLWSCNNGIAYRFNSFVSIGWWHFALYLMMAYKWR